MDCDLLITCVDLASVRGEIGRFYGKKYSTSALWLDTGNAATTGQVILGDLVLGAMGEMRLPNVCDLYSELLDESVTTDMDSDDEPSCSVEAALKKQDLFTNRTVATAACQLLYQLLRHGETNYHGLFIDVSKGTQAPLRIDPVVWQSMGYEKPDRKDAA